MDTSSTQITLDALAAGGVRIHSRARTGRELQAAANEIGANGFAVPLAGSEQAAGEESLAGVGFLLSYFGAKTNQDPIGTMQHYSPQAETYSDAVLGWAGDGYDGIQTSFQGAMPKWGAGLSYPTAIMGGLRDGNGSFLVAFTDTPGIVGQEELHILAPIDVRGGKIVRQVDYWDSSAVDDHFYQQVRTPAPKFPQEYKEQAVGVCADPLLVAVATRLQAALAGADAEAASACFEEEAVLEDLALRTQVIGRTAITRYLKRLLPTAPFGQGSQLRHIVGGSLGGGFEWIGTPQTRVVDGVTALTLDAAGNITRATTVYDGRQLSAAQKQALTLLSTAP